MFCQKFTFSISRNIFQFYSHYFADGLVRKRSQMQLAGSKSTGDLRIIKKASSCSTIYIDDSTVSQPNLKNTIKVVSLAIYYHIKNRTSNQVLDIFDEKLHPLTVMNSHKKCLNVFPKNNIFFSKFSEGWSTFRL